MPTTNKHIILITVLGFVFTNIGFAEDQQEPNFADFYQAIEVGFDDNAVRIGQEIFEQSERRYGADAGFSVLKSKMSAADFLAHQMITQLTKATNRQISAKAKELWGGVAESKDKNSLSIAPAKTFYEDSLEIFSKPVNINGLDDEEKKFLTKFYGLKLRILTSSIAKTGQSLAIAEPAFRGTYDYVLVLPLLHASETRPINIEILPQWMRQSDQLNAFSDSALLHYGFPHYAQAFASEAAQLKQQEFVQENFYITASEKCLKQLPHVAVDCLKRAISLISEEKIDKRIELQFDIVQIWLDSENFTLAAGEAKKIADSYPNHEKSGKAIWLYFYAMSMANNADTILANIDPFISTPNCSEYRAKLMYIKWWALRRQRNQSALIAAIEHQLITEYGDNEMVTPIMLSRATDLLATQDYLGALALLNQLKEKFPTTKAAQQAQKITEKLKAMQSLR